MTSTQLYEFCAQHGIDTYQTSLGKNHSVSILMDGVCAIGIDERGMTEAEKKVHLAHEIGHCERMAFYLPYSPLSLASQNEYKANKWAIQKLLPKEELLLAMDRGTTEVWQIAEHFDVTEDLVRFAIWEYFDISS